MELGPFVACRLPAHLRLPCAELPEVLGRLRDYVGKELHLDAAQRFA